MIGRDLLDGGSGGNNMKRCAADLGRDTDDKCCAVDLFDRDTHKPVGPAPGNALPRQGHRHGRGRQTELEPPCASNHLDRFGHLITRDDGVARGHFKAAPSDVELA